MTQEELKTIANAAREGALIATKPLLTVDEAALFLGCSESNIRKRIGAGQLRVKRMDKRVLIDRTDPLNLPKFGPAPR